jgi:TorA maturation chaperone TorD
LYLLLLARLAADGKPVKPASKTAHEYSELFLGLENPHIRAFASLYSELRWREYGDTAQMEERFNLLKQEYHNIIKTTRRKGIGYWLTRIVSLRGLAYL